ncbi:MAG: hypothetical protein GY941_15070 [Planctomycetes bacterium]|nr:hypothetical protein [Planctomycetota bacterium]
MLSIEKRKTKKESVKECHVRLNKSGLYAALVKPFLKLFGEGPKHHRIMEKGCKMLLREHRERETCAAYMVKCTKSFAASANLLMNGSGIRLCNCHDRCFGCTGMNISNFLES